MEVCSLVSTLPSSLEVTTTFSDEETAKNVATCLRQPLHLRNALATLAPGAVSPPGFRTLTGFCGKPNQVVGWPSMGNIVVPGSTTGGPETMISDAQIWLGRPLLCRSG